MIEVTDSSSAKLHDNKCDFDIRIQKVAYLIFEQQNYNFYAFNTSFCIP